MSSVVLVMLRTAIAESLLEALRKEFGLVLCYETDFTLAGARIKEYDAQVALIEAAETGDRDVSYCLELCSSLRKEAESCKLILMCPDQDEEAIAQTVNAKQDGRIDDFVFYEASIDYLTSKILAML